MKKRKTHNLLISAAFFVASAASCHGQVYVNAQFDLKASLQGKPGFHVETSTNGTAFFASPQSHTLHFNTNDWAALNGRLVNTTGKHATGLWLEPVNGEYDTTTIRAGCLLVRVKSLHSRSTVFTSEFTCRLASRLHGGETGALDSHFASQGVKIWINQVENVPSHPVLLPTNQWAVVSFILPAEVFLNGHATTATPGADSRVVLLGDAHPAEWGRALDAEIFAATLLGGSGDDADFEVVLRGIEHGLALRYGIAKTIRPATALQRDTCRSAGYYSFNAWSTLLLLR